MNNIWAVSTIHKIKSHILESKPPKSWFIDKLIDILAEGVEQHTQELQKDMNIQSLRVLYIDETRKEDYRTWVKNTSDPRLMRVQPVRVLAKDTPTVMMPTYVDEDEDDPEDTTPIVACHEVK